MYNGGFRVIASASNKRPLPTGICIGCDQNGKRLKRLKHLKRLLRWELWHIFENEACSNSTCSLAAMTSASHAEGRQFDPGQVYNSNLHYTSSVLLYQSYNVYLRRIYSNHFTAIANDWNKITPEFGIASVCMMCIKHKICRQPHLWSSGYDVSLTCWRSPARSWPGV